MKNKNEKQMTLTPKKHCPVCTSSRFKVVQSTSLAPDVQFRQDCLKCGYVLKIFKREALM